jgi:hypothetical protein
MKTLKQIREASGGKEAYQKFFNSILKKFGVSSPSELEGKKKKDFFDAIDKGWDGDNEPKEKGESVKEAKKLKGGRGKAEIDINWDGNNKDAKFAQTKYKIKLRQTRDGAVLTGDKQKILAYLQGQDYDMDAEDIEDLYPELMEIYDDPDNLNPDTTHNPDEFEPATDKKPKIKTERAGKKLSLIKVAETSDTYDESELISEIFSRAQMKKAIGIARKSAGQYTKAYNEIEKIKKGLGDEHIIANALKKANEAHEVGTDEYVKHCKKNVPGQNETVDCDARLLGFKASVRRAEGEKQKGRVIVDRRTKGAKEAKLRSEKAKAKREEKRKQKEFAEKYPKLDYQYGNDADLAEILTSSNKKLFGETAANSAASGNVDMAPNSRGKKKKDKVIKRLSY